MADLWLKFYPKDWNGDHNLRTCSLQARGLWIAFLEPMHTAIPYGHVLINGRKPSYLELARLASCRETQVKYGVEELIKNGVASVRPDGVLFSRRMVRDGERLVKRRENGKSGGNPHLAREVIQVVNHEVNHNLNHDLNQVVGPMASGTSGVLGSGSEDKQGGEFFDEPWAEFIQAYPGRRRTGSWLANQAFVGACQAIGYPALRAKLEQMKQTDDWRRGYAPGMEKWLVNKLWLQDAEDEKADGVDAVRRELAKLDAAKVNRG